MSSTFGSIVIRLALIVPLIGLWFIMQPSRSYACSCIPYGSPSEELEESAAVFLGRVFSVSTFGGSQGSWGSESLLVEFDVQVVWKGDVEQTARLTTSRSGPACGYHFVEDVEYLVYSYSGSRVGLCSRTRPLSEAAADLVELGKGHDPAPNTLAATKRGEGDERRVPAPGTPAPTAEAAADRGERVKAVVSDSGTTAPTPEAAADKTGLANEGEAASGGRDSAPEVSENQAGGGCVLSRHTTDPSVMGLMLGVAWLGLRKRRSGAE